MVQHQHIGFFAIAQLKEGTQQGNTQHQPCGFAAGRSQADKPEHQQIDQQQGRQRLLTIGQKSHIPAEKTEKPCPAHICQHKCCRMKAETPADMAFSQPCKKQHQQAQALIPDGACGFPQAKPRPRGRRLLGGDPLVCLVETVESQPRDEAGQQSDIKHDIFLLISREN